MTVDGKKRTLKAYAPKTGEPALMIRDDKGFIAMLKNAHEISVDVTPVDSGKKETLVYEVGGFEPAEWKDPGKPRRRKAADEAVGKPWVQVCVLPAAKHAVSLWPRCMLSTLCRSRTLEVAAAG